eukprot:364550-Chlamydomonas_euryale.AAC.2
MPVILVVPATAHGCMHPKRNFEPRMLGCSFSDTRVDLLRTGEHVPLNPILYVVWCVHLAPRTAVLEPVCLDKPFSVGMLLLPTPLPVLSGLRAEVERALRVLDGAVACFDAVSGVEPQSETVWRQADRYKVPRIAFVNKMDRMGANFMRTYDMLISNLGAVPLPVQLPIGAEDTFEGVVDLVNMKAIVWNGEELGATFDVTDIPEAMKAEAEEWHQKLIDMVVEQDDAVLEKYIEGEMPDAETLTKLIRKGCIKRAFTPMLCGTAFKNKGVQPLLDAVLAYLPSPMDVEDVQGVDVDDTEKTLTRPPADAAPFSALAFKIMTDPFVGSLTFVRIYSGKLESGTYAFNPAKGKKERIGRVMVMHANDRQDVKAAFAGDIVAIAGLKDTVTGDTLCDDKEPIILEKMDFPDPVIKIAIEPKSKADLEKMGMGLNKLAQEDPSFGYARDEETNQTVIEGMGESRREQDRTQHCATKARRGAQGPVWGAGG